MRRRWSRTSKVFAVLAVVSGAGAFLLVRGYQARLEALRPAVGPPTAVVVATRTLSRGDVLTEDDLRVMDVPSVYAPPGSLRSAEAAIGATLVSDLAAGEAVTRTRVGGAGGRVAALVPSGLRAFPVAADLPIDAVEVGDRVDVLATFGGHQPHTETAATGLEVLLVLGGDGSSDGLALTSAGGDAPVLVLLVSPDEAERLAYAKAFADLTVTVAPTETTAPLIETEG